MSVLATAVTRVAQPAPATPSSGNGPRPVTSEKARTALATTVIIVATMGRVGWPTERSTPDMIALSITGRVASTVSRK